MKILVLSVSIILIIGCKGSGEIVVGTDEITKIDLKNKDTTIFFSGSDKDTPYTIVVTSTPKEDEPHDMKINLAFEVETKGASLSRATSKEETGNHSSLESAQIYKKTDALKSSRDFKIPHDSSDKRAAIKIGESEKFALYKDERLSEEFDKGLKVNDFLNALENIESRVNFFAGDISDVDSNGRVIFVFTQFGKESIKGVFEGDDIRGLRNFGKEEVLYISGKESTLTRISAMAHELQHLINFNYKYTLPGKDKKKVDEKTKEHFGINEGLSHLIQDLCGYSNTVDTSIVSAYLLHSAATSLKTEFSSDSENPEEEAKVRGGNYLFLRYLYEQLGENSFSAAGTIEPSKGGDFIRNLIQSTEVGYEKIEKLYGKPMGDLMLDWGITISGKAAKENQYKYNERKDDIFTENKRGVDLSNTNSKGAHTVPLKKEQEFKVPHYGIVLFTLTVPKRSNKEMSMQVNIKDTKGNFKMALIPQI